MTRDEAERLRPGDVVVACVPPDALGPLTLMRGVVVGQEHSTNDCGFVVRLAEARLEVLADPWTMPSRTYHPQFLRRVHP